MHIFAKKKIMDIDEARIILCGQCINDNWALLNTLHKVISGKRVDDMRTISVVKVNNGITRSAEQVSETLVQEFRKDYLNIVKAIYDEEVNSPKRLFARLYEDLSSLISLPSDNLNNLIYFPVKPFVYEIADELGYKQEQMSLDCKLIISDQSRWKTPGRSYDLSALKSTIKRADEIIAAHKDTVWLKNDVLSMMLIFDIHADLAGLEEDIIELHSQRRRFRVTAVYEIGRYKIVVFKPRIIRGTRTELAYMDNDVFWTQEVTRNYNPSQIRPKLYFLASKRKKGESENHYFKIKDTVDVPAGERYCGHINYRQYKPRKDEVTHGWSNRFSYSDRELIKCRNLETDQIGKGVTGPAVIVSLDTMSAFPYWEESTPFLMDDDMVPIELCKESESKSYSVLAKRINDKFSKIVYDLRHDSRLLSLRKALPVTNEDKKYILMNSWSRFALERDKKVSAINPYRYPEKVWKNLCNVEDNINAYLKAMHEAGFLNKGNKPGIYRCTDPNGSKLLKNTEAAIFVIEVSPFLDLYVKKTDEELPMQFGSGCATFEFRIQYGGHLLDGYFEHRLDLERGSLKRIKKHALEAFDGTLDRSNKRTYDNIEYLSKTDKRILKIHLIILAVSLKLGLVKENVEELEKELTGDGKLVKFMKAKF